MGVDWQVGRRVILRRKGLKRKKEAVILICAEHMQCKRFIFYFLLYLGSFLSSAVID